VIGVYEGYLSMAGVELVNNERTATYARTLGITAINCPPCTIAPALDEPPYTTPTADAAPWFDPYAPESGGFAGFFGLQVRGFNSSPITRTPIERLGDGAVITRARYNHREVVYTGVAMAVDQCSLSYGLAWLSTALRGSTCNPCGGVEACAYTCCPTPENEESTIRTMAQVGVLEGPITNRVAALGRKCGGTDQPVIAEVEFTLILGRPWLYRSPIPIITGVSPPPGQNCGAVGQSWDSVAATFATWDDVDFGVANWNELADEPECVQWNGQGCPNDPGEYDQFGCSRLAGHSCAEDPERPVDCPEPPAPPSVPRPYDPCAVCFDGPNTKTASVTVPPNATPAWLDQVPLIEVTTGTQPARAILLRFYSNPTGATGVCDPNLLDPCTACATMAIPYVPPGATLTVDGRDFTASLDCDGGRGTAVIDDSTGIFGPNGRPYTWPVFDCNGFCVTFTVPCDFPDDVLVNVSVVAREDAA
jgi:hypothetical protein